MTTALLARRFLADAARNRVNIALLVVVPAVFVVVLARELADSAKILGSSANTIAVETATAGWAAGFITAIAMYFQLRAARAADRRLVIAGLDPHRLVAARLATGLSLAAVASAAALVALAARTGIHDPERVIAGTLMFAVIYLAIGALVGALVADPVNGTVLILFVWLLDVIFGPAFGSAGRAGTRALPTHFVTLWMIGLHTNHGGRLGDLGWALVWTFAALTVGWAVLAHTTRAANQRRRSAEPGSVRAQLAVGLRMGLREASRNRVLWVLLVLVPAVMVLLTRWTTPRSFTTVPVNEHGHQVPERFWFPDIHPGIMTPMAIGALAALVGLFTVLGARSGDRRLALAGFRSGSLLSSRLAVVVVGALVVTGASLAMTRTVFDARQWGTYIAANLLIALTYGFVGVLIGTVLGRVGGVFVAFLIPFVDLLTQSPMIHPILPGWARFLPGYGASRMLYDAALTTGFSDTGPLLVALAWLAGLGLLVALLFHQSASPAHRTAPHPTAGRLP